MNDENGGGRRYMAHRRWYLHAEFWLKYVQVRKRPCCRSTSRWSVISKLYSEDGRS